MKLVILLLLISVYCCTLVVAASAAPQLRSTKPAPEKFQVQFITTIDPSLPITLNVTRAWSPHGVDRFYELLQQDVKYYDGNTFFRVVPRFVVQFGINGDPAVSAQWVNENILDDAVVASNVRGTVAFAMSSEPNSRTTQLYVNYGDNSRLDGMGFAPFAVISEADMKLLDRVYSGYGERPDQEMIYERGDEYLKSQFPKLDRILRANIIVKP